MGRWGLNFELGFDFFDAGAEVGPFAVGLLEFFGEVGVGAGGLGEFFGVAADFWGVHTLGDGGLAGFDLGDDGFGFDKVGLEGLEDFVALFADGGVALAALFGVETRAFGLARLLRSEFRGFLFS